MTETAEITYQATRESSRAMENWREWEAPFQEFARSISKNILVRNYRGIPSSMENIEDENTWRIHIYSVPASVRNSGRGPSFYQNIIWGVAVGSYAEYSFVVNDGYQDLEEAIIVDSDISESAQNEGVIPQFVAAIYPDSRHIYIPFDLSRVGPSVSIMQLSSLVLTKCASILNLENLDEFRAELIIERRKESRKRFIELIGRRKQSRISEAESNLQNIENALREIGSQIQAQLRSRETAIETLKVVKNSKANEDKLTKEWDLILTHPSVETIEVLGDELVVKTKSLVSKTLPDTSTRLLGNFDIRFSPQANRMPKVFCTSQHPFDGWEHPHIPSNGEVCWGNMTESVATFISKAEYSIATQIIIRFLMEPWEEESWGMKIWSWPVHTIDDGKTPYGPNSFCANCEQPLEHCECHDICAHCGGDQDNCDCYFCDRCGMIYRTAGGANVADCRCVRCNRCGASVTECVNNDYCDRCTECNEILEECSCIVCACSDCQNNVEVSGDFCESCIRSGCPQ